MHAYNSGSYWSDCGSSYYPRSRHGAPVVPHAGAEGGEPAHRLRPGLYNSILRFPPSPLHPSHPPILQHPVLLFLPRNFIPRLITNGSHPSHAKNLCQSVSNSSPESHPKSTGSGGNGSSTSPQPPSANTFPSASTVAKL